MPTDAHSVSPDSACSENSYMYGIGYGGGTIWLEIDVLTSCIYVSPIVRAYIQNCGIAGGATENTDVWFSQSNQVSGTRLAESGRTGLVTYPNDCNWYQGAWVRGYGQTYTVPLYGLGWFYKYDTGSTTNGRWVSAN